MRARVCLVTGGTGFLGRRLISLLLAEGWQVRVLSRRRPLGAPELTGVGAEVYQGDLSAPDGLGRALRRVDVVFHLAGETQDPRRFAAVNVSGTRYLLETALAEGVQRVVHVSSVGVVGSPPALTVTETTACHPRNEYERTKLAGERLALEFCSGRGLPVTVIRPANVFGDGDPQRRLLTLVRQVQRGQFVFVGSADAVVNYVYVDDVARACRLLADRETAVGEIYNVSDPAGIVEFVTSIAADTGGPIPTRRVPAWTAYAAGLGADLISAVLRRPLGLTSAKISAARSRRIYSSDKLRREAPDWPPVGWREGVRRVVAWCRGNGLL
jgi:dihydroflavonol-4-reductase